MNTQETAATVPARMFPILGSPTLKAVPWALLEPHRRQASDNHYQSLEQLAERGGLGVLEAWAAMTGRNLLSYDKARWPSEAAAEAWLLQRAAELGSAAVDTPAGDVDQARMQPLLYLSEKQLPTLGIGYYVPYRLQPEGNFQLPLYRRPVPPPAAQPATEGDPAKLAAQRLTALTAAQAAAAVAAEREACAQLCDAQATREPYGHAKFAATLCAQAIRERGATAEIPL